MRSRSRLLPAISAGLCVVLGTLVVVLAHRVSADRRLEVARRSALAAAPRIARDVLSYDYRTIDADIGRAERDTTGAFARQYAGTAVRLESTAAADRAIVQAQPHQPGIVSATADEVVILLYIDQLSVTQPNGAGVPTTRVEQSRVQMTLSNVRGSWRLAALSAL